MRPGQVVAQPDGHERELGAFADRLRAISGHVRLKWASGCSRSKPMTLLKACSASSLRFISRQTWPISATPARNAPSPARYLRAVLLAPLFESQRLTRSEFGADRRIIAPTSESRGGRLTGNATAKRQTDRLGAPVLTVRCAEHCCRSQPTVRCPHTTQSGPQRVELGRRQCCRKRTRDGSPKRIPAPSLTSATPGIRRSQGRMAPPPLISRLRTGTPPSSGDH